MGFCPRPPGKFQSLSVIKIDGGAIKVDEFGKVFFSTSLSLVSAVILFLLASLSEKVRVQPVNQLLGQLC